jgi:hypothetical protein
MSILSPRTQVDPFCDMSKNMLEELSKVEAKDDLSPPSPHTKTVRTAKLALLRAAFWEVYNLGWTDARRSKHVP